MKNRQPVHGRFSKARTKYIIPGVAARILIFEHAYKFNKYIRISITFVFYYFFRQVLKFQSFYRCCTPRHFDHSALFIFIDHAVFNISFSFSRITKYRIIAFRNALILFPGKFRLSKTLLRFSRRRSTRGGGLGGPKPSPRLV